MNFIDRSALHLAQSIRKHNPNSGSEVALKYALVLLLNTSIAIFLALSICFFTGHMKDALISASGFLILRYFAGGLHLNSSLACTLFSGFIVTVIAHIDFTYTYTSMTVDVLSILILLKTAPSGIEGVSRIDKKYYPVLKLISVLIVLSNITVFQTTVLSATFLTTAVLTTNSAFRIIEFIERRTSQ